MSALDFTREQLAQYILNSAKESSISKIKSIILNEKKEEEVVAYTVKGQPLTKAMYIKKVKDAEASVKAGNYTTVEDLEKEAENW